MCKCWWTKGVESNHSPLVTRKVPVSSACNLFRSNNIAESIGKALIAVQASIDAPISPNVCYRVPPWVHERGKDRVTEPKLGVGRKRETLPGKMFAAITLFPAAFRACTECPIGSCSG